ncbi:hypothetical protein SAMN05421869_12897 [Nonomuraea jiangxiensis]|uniref:Uncharacterized protein n=1 Tax=Nonomuraea jiangxiensis TaxID=633440 RepID=A0A1G9LS41_9ACTN|nr:hypothetical protein SAMN05421869_12897 [Nonomuraea jiangxiensis]
MSNDLSAINEQCVFEKQLIIIAKLSPEGTTEQLRPKLPLELDGGEVTVRFVHGR